jgi:hypothetical protein
MGKHLSSIAVVASAALLLCMQAARADDTPPLTCQDCASLIGSAMPDDARARLADVTDTDGDEFSLPTQVYFGAMTLDVDSELMTCDLRVYMRDGKACGLELDYFPSEDVCFEDLPFADQEAAFDKIYGNIADNYAGDDGGKTVYYDENGGLYQYKDPSNVTWSLAWAANHELVVTFDSPDFYEEHTALTTARQHGEMTDVSGVSEN